MPTKHRNSMTNKLLQCVILVISLSLFCMTVKLLTGCTVKDVKVYEKEGKLYGVTDGLFKSQWDDFYLRGFSYSEGEYWEDAASDFLVAISKRALDQRRARTYGLHFVNYFPNRELGIAYYNLGRFKESMQYLEASLASVETARAKYYLNRARRAWLEQTKLDKDPPVINVQFPSPLYRTNDFAVLVQGTARDNYFVSNIVYNGEPSPLELSRREVKFSKEFPLHQGKNVIILCSEDILGRVSDPLNISINVDREGPLVCLKVLINKDGSVMVKGAVHDRSGIVRIMINNRGVVFQDPQMTYVNEMFANSSFNKDIGISFEAEDIVGNKTAGLIQLDLSKNNPKTQGINLNGLEHGIITFLDTLFLQGSVCISEGISDLMINSQSLMPPEEDKTSAEFLRFLSMQKPVYLAFSKRVKLLHEKNSIITSLADGSGKTIEKPVTIIKKVPLIRQISSRMSAAVFPFTEHGKSGDNLQNYVHTVLLTAFKNQKRFKVSVAEEFERALKGGLTSIEKHTAVKLGRLMGVETVLIGDINASGKSVGIDARLVDTATSLVIAEKDVYWESSLRSDLRANIDWLALKFKKQFPICEGTVIAKQPGEAIISIGQDDLIQPGMRFLVFNETPPTAISETQIDLGSDSEITALLTVKKIDRKSTFANILKIYMGNEIHVGDKVITK